MDLSTTERSTSKGSNRPRWAVIGSGIGGLAAAIRLRARDVSVDVFEKNPQSGGKLTEIFVGGFRFDAGPSLFTMPGWLGDLFTLHHRKLEDYFTYATLPESCRYFFEDGLELHGYTDLDRWAREISEKTADSYQSVQDFYRYSARIYGITAPVFLQKSLHRLDTYFNRAIIPSLLGLGKIDLGRTMNTANQSFFQDPRTVQVFNRFSTYNGSNPYLAPATLNVIPHLEGHFGAYFPQGGMISIRNSLLQLASEVGVNILYQQEVQQITHTCGRVTGLRVGQQPVSYDGVISNMDIYPTYKKLLPDDKAPEKILARERSSSALIFYWGISSTFPRLGLHNIFFSREYRDEFDQIREGRIPEDPTIYLNISSRYKTDDAPEGMENWFAMINVPPNTGQSWDEMVQKARTDILRKLSRMLGIQVEPLIVAERVLDPRSIEERTVSYQGSIYGSSSNEPLSAFFRHPNYSATTKGLYFCGGSVHPGGGIPLVLQSAKITVELIEKRENI